MAITGNIERPNKTRELTPEQMNAMLAKDLEPELTDKPVRTPVSMTDKEVKKNYQVMITPSVHDAGVQAAKDLGDSFSGLMESLLEEYLRSRKYLIYECSIFTT